MAWSKGPSYVSWLALIVALSVADMHRAVEVRLGQSVSKDSVNSCLSTGARSAQPRFQRVAPARYRLTMRIKARKGSTSR
jgi:hypothetical protein